MKKALLAILAVLLLNGLNTEATQKRGGSLTFDVGDERKVITRSIDKHLLLRVVRVDSGTQGDFSRDIQVVRKPFHINSSNLLYHSREWHGPYPSQVDAWQVAKEYFPNERKLDVRGYPYEVKIILIDPVVAGDEPSFVSGKIKIIWKRKLEAAPQVRELSFSIRGPRHKRLQPTAR